MPAAEVTAVPGVNEEPTDGITVQVTDSPLGYTPTTSAVIVARLDSTHGSSHGDGPVVVAATELIERRAVTDDRQFDSRETLRQSGEGADQILGALHFDQAGDMQDDRRLLGGVARLELAVFHADRERGLLGGRAGDEPDCDQDGARGSGEKLAH